MGQDKRGMNIEGNKGQINISSDQSHMQNTMNVYSTHSSEDLSQLQAAATVLIEQLQQSQHIEDLDKQGIIRLIKLVQDDISTNSSPDQSILHLLNQKLENYIPLLTGISAANSTISAINDFKSVLTPLLGG